MINCDKAIGKADISCVVQNQNFNVILVFTSEGDPLDLSLYPSVKFEIFKGSIPILKKTLEDSINIQNNEMTINLLQEDLKSIRDNVDLVYELVLINGTNQNLYALTGKFNIIKTLTR